MVVSHQDSRRWQAHHLESLIGKDACAQLRAAGVDCTREPGEEILGPRDSPGAVALLERGVAIERVIAEDGRSVALDVLSATDVLGYRDGAGDIAPRSVYVASTEVAFRLIDEGSLTELLNDLLAVQDGLNERLAERRAVLVRRFAELGLASEVLVARLVTEVLPHYANIEGHPSNTIQMAIPDLATMAGLTPTETKLILRRFDADGLLACGGGTITVENLPKLVGRAWLGDGAVDSD